MNRRSFLTACIATCTAPAIVRASSLMLIVDRSIDFRLRQFMRDGRVMFYPGDEVPHWIFKPVLKANLDGKFGTSAFQSRALVENVEDSFRITPDSWPVWEWRNFHHTTFYGQSPSGASHGNRNVVLERPLDEDLYAGFERYELPIEKDSARIQLPILSENRIAA